VLDFSNITKPVVEKKHFKFSQITANVERVKNIIDNNLKRPEDASMTSFQEPCWKPV
jgi:hypothetical protein